MTQEQRNNLGQILASMGVIYGRNDLTPPVLSMYLDDLEAAGLSFANAVIACTRYRRDKKNIRFPLPAQLIDAARPEFEPKTLATDIARRIDKACADHGWNWDQGFFHSFSPDSDQATFYFEANTPEGPKSFWTFKEAVIAELGEIGWNAICARGGWTQIHQSSKEMPEGTFIAQLRDQIESTIALARQGVDVTRIGLPSPSNPSGELQHVGKLLDFKRPDPETP